MVDTSVVVAAWGDETLLRRCLAHLDAERVHGVVASEPLAIEVIVVTSLAEQASERVAVDFPWAQVESVPNGTVFALRARGVSLAQGALVAIIEDHVVVEPGWLGALQQAHAAGHRILGGPVENGSVASLVDWALYFVEYGMYMPPVPGGEVAAVSGVNVAYSATVLQACRDTWIAAFHENEVNDALAASGLRPFMVSAAIVHTHLPMSFWGAAAHLFAGGRQFASYRAVPATLAWRAVRVLVAPAIPFVLFARLAQRVRRRRPDRILLLLRSAVTTLVVLGAWAAGELAGYALPQLPRVVRRA